METISDHAIAINGCATTKIYCRPNCPPGRRTKPENRLHFESTADARLAGFRSCLVCTPNEPADGLAGGGVERPEAGGGADQQLVAVGGEADGAQSAQLGAERDPFGDLLRVGRVEPEALLTGDGDHGLRGSFVGRDSPEVFEQAAAFGG